MNNSVFRKQFHVLTKASPDPVFIVQIVDDKYKKLHCNFVVYEVGRWNEDGSPYLSEEYMSLEIKLSGCCNMSIGNRIDEPTAYGDRTGYLHLHAPEDFRDFCSLLPLLYDFAFKEMDMGEENRWDLPKDFQYEMQEVSIQPVLTY